MARSTNQASKISLIFKKIISRLYLHIYIIDSNKTITFFLFMCAHVFMALTLKFFFLFTYAHVLMAFYLKFALLTLKLSP